MKKFLIGLGVVIVLVVAALFVVPPLVPVDVYKDQITRQVRAATGRDLVIRGDISLSLLPGAALEVNDVTFANAPGAAAPRMATLKRMVVSLKLMPLLSGEVEVSRFVLVDPVINLEVDKRGRPNWQFASAPAAVEKPAARKPTGTSAGKEAAEKETAEGGGLAIADVRLGDVRLVNGTITYFDARSGEKEQVTGANLTLSLPRLAGPFDAKGDLTWHGKVIKVSLHAGNARDLMAGVSTPVRMEVRSEPVDLAFEGSVTNAKRIQAQGDAKLAVPSVRGLAEWAGSPLEVEGTGFGPLKISGRVAVKGAAVSFSNADIAFDSIRARGGFTYVGAAVPRVKGRLDVERLDLNPYLPPQKPKPASTAAGPAQPSPAGKPAPAAAPAPSHGWSDEPIDTSALKSADADLTFTAREILFQRIKIGRSAVHMVLKGGRLVLDLTDLALYGGSGRAHIVVDGRGPVLGVEKDLTLTGIQAGPFLRDAADFDRLEGTAEARIKVRGKGNSQRAIVSSLDGDGAVKFLNGAIKGMNLAAMLRSVSPAALNQGIGAAKKTDFTELSGTFTIKRGILENKDLIMKSPLLRVTGAGKANLPARTVDYRIEPKVVGTLEGQGGAATGQGLVFPVVVKGSWDDPQWSLELFNPRKLGPQGVVGAVGAIKNQAEQIKKGGIKGLLQGLTGAAPQPAPAPSTGTGSQPAPQTPLIDPKNPLGTLKKLLPGLQ